MQGNTSSRRQTRELIGKLYRLIGRKQRIGFIAISVLMLVSAGLSQITPLAVGRLTDSVLGESGLNFATVLPFLLLILAVNVVNEVIKVGRRLVVEDTATRVQKAARQSAVAALLHAPFSYFRLHMTGNIHGRLNRSLEGTTKLVKLLFMDFAPSIFTAVAAIVVIFVKLPPLIALITILVVPIGILVVSRQIATQKGIRVELLGAKADMDGSVVELLGGIETIRVTDNAAFEEKRLAERSEALRAREMRHHSAMAFYDCLKFTNEALFNVLVIGASVLLAVRGEISVGTILTSYLCFLRLTGPLRELHRILDELSESAVLADEYFRLRDIPKDFSYAEPSSAREETSAAAGLILENPNFAYPETPNRKVLNGISLEIRPGEFIGVAGPSGCGKSSFIKTLTRLEPYQGRIVFGGTPLSELSRAELARRMALIPQSPFVIADTVFNNICYGFKGEASPEMVREAARRAFIERDILELEGGYGFPVSEDGNNLSGGQGQRLAIARIFLRNPRLLILDEATSALDNTSEKHVQVEIERLQRESRTTVISMAHRLTTLENCDRVLVFDKGRVVQEGKYRDLIEQPGIFRNTHLGLLK